MSGAEAVYGLCLLTSILCAGLLLRSWRASRVPLLMFTALCFGFLALNNLLVFADMMLLPGKDLTVWRHLSSLAAIGVLLYGFIWEVE